MGYMESFILKTLTRKSVASRRGAVADKDVYV